MRDHKIVNRLGGRLKCDDCNESDSNYEKHLRPGNQAADFLAFLIIVADIKQVKVIELL
jgi:hypothetical protein